MKALLFNVNIPLFAAVQALRPLSERVCYDGPFSTIRLVDHPEPRLPSEEWVKIRTELCGFCGSDLNLIMLKDSPTASPFTSFPCVPGHEVCGAVVEAGARVDTCEVGDRVTVAPMLNCTARGISPECRSCSRGRPANCEKYAEGSIAPGMFNGLCKDIPGGFGEYMIAHRSQVYRVPEGVSRESAALTEPLAVAVQAVLDNRPDDEDKVLVIGGGVIGAMVVKAIRALEIRCDLTVVEPSPFHADYVRRSGADRVIGTGVFEEAERITGGRAYKPMLKERILMGGFDKVFDTVGHSHTLNTAMRVMSTLGTLSVIGIGNDVKLDLTPLWLKLQTIKGCYAYGYNETPEGRKQAFEIALEMLARKAVCVEDMLTHRFRIEDYRKMIVVNLHKARYRAIKTAIVFS